MDGIINKLLIAAVFGGLGLGAAWVAVPNGGVEYLTGGFAGGVLVTGIFLQLERKLLSLSAKGIIGAIIGLMLGLLAAILALSAIGDSIPLSGSSRFLAVIGVLFFFSILFARVGRHFGALLKLTSLGALGGGYGASAKILDTSVIIDGRISDLIDSGFLDGQVIVPQFVLRELQLVADSADSIRRNRGRRGLEILHNLQRDANLDIRIVDTDFPRIREVDAKLVALAREVGGSVLTNDYNLNRVAGIQNVKVLNINNLANALRPVVLPGELLAVKVIKPGAQDGQGVGYLEDGTMVVIDNASRLLDQTIDVEVTTVLQTDKGRMIFARADVEEDMDRFDDRRDKKRARR